MLVLKRREGQWVEVTHPASGDILRIRVCKIEAGRPGSTAHLNLVFDDDERRFEIARPEQPRAVAGGMETIGRADS